MYVRRKILLALVEVFGGSVSSTDCYKLMFLLCKRTNHNFYDYFPYKFGAYSYMLNQDKIRLTQLNYFVSGDKFELVGSNNGYINQVDEAIRKQIFALKSEVGTLLGQKLVRKTYLEYPYFATHSLIANHILSSSEYHHIEKFKSFDESPTLFTIGYEGITIDSYLNKLLEYNIHTLVDVRKNPVSMKYGFSKNQLERYVTSVGIEYRHLPDLGIPSHMRRDLKATRDYGDLFHKYLTEMLPNELESISLLLRIIKETNRVALTCFEADHCECHRSKITEYLMSDSSFQIPVTHI